MAGARQHRGSGALGILGPPPRTVAVDGTAAARLAPGFFGRFARRGVSFVAALGRAGDDIGSAEPAREIDIAAAPRAERAIGDVARAAADRTPVPGFGC